MYWSTGLWENARQADRADGAAQYKSFSGMHRPFPRTGFTTHFHSGTEKPRMDQGGRGEERVRPRRQLICICMLPEPAMHWRKAAGAFVAWKWMDVV